MEHAVFFAVRFMWNERQMLSALAGFPVASLLQIVALRFLAWPRGSKSVIDRRSQPAWVD